MMIRPAASTSAMWAPDGAVSGGMWACITGSCARVSSTWNCNPYARRPIANA